MAGILGALHWWDEWQLRVLVLGSLGLQWFLLFAAPMRKYTIPRWCRTFIWLAYIGSDALAIYALATLFNRHAHASSSSSCGNGDALEVLWAPVLLIHLGGQEEITAYNIEDNELWTRHTVTLVSQVAVAVYAFCKSWPSSGDRRLLASAILLFVVGILSFSEKPWALRRASINRLAAVSSRLHGRERKPRRRWGLFTKLEDKYISCWARTTHYWTTDNNRQGQADQVLSDGDKVHMILSDMSLFAASSDLTKRELMKQDSIRAGEMRRQRERGVELVQVEVEGDIADEEDEEQRQVLGPLSPTAEWGSKRWLRIAFGLIYTRINVATTPAYLAFHFLLVPAIHVAAITLFAASRKRGYNPTDVRITYVILFVTAALDVLAESIRQLLYRAMSAAGVPALCETLPQYSLLGSARRRMHPAAGRLLKCAARLGLEEYFVCGRENLLYWRVAGFVMLDLVRATGLDLATYRTFTGSNWTLTKELQLHCRAEIRRTLRESFDESVLIWHIATEICFRRSPRRQPGAAGGTGDHEECTLAISNYMAHLLNFRADMLMTGSRRHLLTEALEDLESITLSLSTGRTKTKVDDAAVLEAIRNAGKSERHKYPLIHDACKLSDELMEVRPEETRWELMYRAWVGMLCYSASMCRGYLHAKSLGEGGEFLSFVWLMLSLKGAKTLADKLQMPEPDAQESAAAGEETATATEMPSTDDLVSLVDPPGKSR
ncbi:uncharacterized protein C2845_PM07G06810 [Panicum miliaceum]|uniref:DUF4220 domain-containing protein n=1 Tax=Panicum miliaceum TaxID=4540 RepID=A0A3L6SNL0_PANMI|nr:uncharacterized protein C2845_PM07G06810 [Panicum miliaceum]